MVTALDSYLGSNELKKLIVSRSTEFELPLKAICLDLGIDYANFMQSYINSNENNKFKIEEGKFLELLKHLGINVRYQFIINDKSDYAAKKEYLREVFNKYNNG